MATSPISPSPFHKVIKAVSEVRTKSGLSALAIVVLFLSFCFSLFLAKDLLQWVLTIMSLLCLVGFSVFAVITNKDSINKGKGVENEHRKPKH